VLRHPWSGSANCTAGDNYWRSLPARYQQEADALSNLTGWDVAAIRDKMAANGQSFTPNTSGIGPWLERLFR
jgi:hypothetical protein